MLKVSPGPWLAVGGLGNPVYLSVSAMGELGRGVTWTRGDDLDLNRAYETLALSPNLSHNVVRLTSPEIKH